MIYWDTSCILKLYTPESDSEVYLAMAEGVSEPHCSSEVLDAELFYALCQKQMRGDIKPGWAKRLHKKFRSDIRKGRVMLFPVGHEVIAKAVEIAQDCYAQKPPIMLRSLDGIHLATALAAKSTKIATTDQRMQMAAVRLGLSLAKP